MDALLTWFEDADRVALLPYAGLFLGLVFGVVAQRSRFCLRSAIVQSGGQGIGPMAGSFAAALFVAIAGAQLLGVFELVDFSETRFVGESLPVAALVLGGAMFGAGMVLTRGCASRLTVLSAQGNLRAITVLLIFAVTAYMTLRGLLSQPRLAFSEFGSIEIDTAALSGILGPVLLIGLLAVIWKSGATAMSVGAGFAVGLIVVAGWFATGHLLLDEFDPRAADSLAFTSGASDALFYSMASTAVDPGFPAAVVGGTLIGAFLAALGARELRLESFETPEQTLRYFLGAVLMGIGGVLAGGCTIGAGLTGLSTLTLGPLLALASIIIGAAATHRLVDAEPTSGISAVPAE